MPHRTAACPFREVSLPEITRLVRPLLTDEPPAGLPARYSGRWPSTLRVLTRYCQKAMNEGSARIVSDCVISNDSEISQINALLRLQDPPMRIRRSGRPSMVCVEVRSPALPGVRSRGLTLVESQEETVRTLIDRLDAGERMLVLRGPRYSGKSVILRSLHATMEARGEPVRFVLLPDGATACELHGVVCGGSAPESKAQAAHEVARALPDRELVVVDVEGTPGDGLAEALRFLACARDAAVVLAATGGMALTEENAVQVPLLRDGSDGVLDAQSEPWRLFSAKLPRSSVRELRASAPACRDLAAVFAAWRQDPGSIVRLGRRVAALTNAGVLESLLRAERLSAEREATSRRLVIEARINGLLAAAERGGAGPQRRALGCLVVLPESFGTADLSLASGLPELAAEVELRAWRDHGLIRGDADRYHTEQAVRTTLGLVHPGVCSRAIGDLLDRGTLIDAIGTASQDTETVAWLPAVLAVARFGTDEHVVRMAQGSLNLLAARCLCGDRRNELLAIMAALAERLPDEAPEKCVSARWAATAAYYLGEQPATVYWSGICDAAAHTDIHRAMALNLRGAITIHAAPESADALRAAAEMFCESRDIYTVAAASSDSESAQRQHATSAQTMQMNVAQVYESLGELDAAERMLDGIGPCRHPLLLTQYLLARVMVTARRGDLPGARTHYRSLLDTEHADNAVCWLPTLLSGVAVRLVSLGARMPTDRLGPVRVCSKIPDGMASDALRYIRDRNALDRRFIERFEAHDLGWAQSCVGGSEGAEPRHPDAEDFRDRANAFDTL